MASPLTSPFHSRHQGGLVGTDSEEEVSLSWLLLFTSRHLLKDAKRYTSLFLGPQLEIVME